MAAVAAGIRDDPYLNRRERPVGFCPQLHVSRHLMTRGCTDELFLARELPFDRPANLKNRQHAEILGYHLLLAAETAAHPLGENVELARVESKDMAELLVHDERSLRAGADMNPAVVPLPCDRTVRFQMDMLDPRRRVGHLVNGVGCREPILNAADLAMDFGIDITLRLVPFVVEDRSIRLHSDHRVENRGQNFVIHPDFATGGFCSRFALGNDRNDPLAYEANDVVENIGVVGVDQVILMYGSAKKATGNILPGKNLDDTRDGQRRLGVDALDACVGMWRT